VAVKCFITLAPGLLSCLAKCLSQIVADDGPLLRRRDENRVVVGDADLNDRALELENSGHVDLIPSLSTIKIDIESLQNRLLKDCCVPTTSAGIPRVSFFFSFLSLLQHQFTVLMNQTRQAVRAVKQSIYS
jgi:hypothetical protein